jgi:O-methyltransferase involved in polyketide biosynthesis
MEAVSHGLTGVSETLLIPLSARVLESRRADTAFADPEAERIADRLHADLARYTQEWHVVEVVVGRTAIFDRAVRRWLVDHPGGRVVSLGAGLCTRFHRVDDDLVRWLDVDLPDVIALKRQVVTETDRYRLFAGSVLDDGWLDAVDATPSAAPPATLFVAEGLLMYLEEAQVAALLARIRDRFPGSEAWLEVISPLLLRTLGRASRSIQATGAQFRWGLADAKRLETLVPGLAVLGVEHPNEVYPERWRWMRILRYVPPIHTALKCVHVRLER